MHLFPAIRRILGFGSESQAIRQQKQAPRVLSETHQVLQDAAAILRELQPHAAGMSFVPEKFPEPLPELPAHDPRELEDLVAVDTLLAAIEDISPEFAKQWRAFAAGEAIRPALHTQMSHYAAYVLALIKHDREAELAKVFDLVERMVIFGNDQVLAAVTVGFLESLHNLASWEKLGTNLVRTYLLTASWRVWRAIAWLFRGGRGVADLPVSEARLVADAIRAISLKCYGREKVARRIEASLRQASEEKAEAMLASSG